MNRRKAWLGVIIMVFLLIQAWFVQLNTTYPVLGFELKHEKEGWVVSGFSSMNASSEILVRVGDHILEVNGVPADDFMTIKKWGIVEQAERVKVARDGRIMELSVGHVSHPVLTTLGSYLAQYGSLFLSALLLLKYRSSESARRLAYVFLNIGLIFMSLGASLRGDALGKVILSFETMYLPVVFLHFLQVFLKEKGRITLIPHSIRRVYAAILVLSSGNWLLLTDLPIVHTAYRITQVLTLLVIVIGMLGNVMFLFFVYWKHRKTNMYVAVILKFITISLFLSLMPITLFSFLPQLVFGHEWFNSIYMSWFIFIFPLTLAYMITNQRLYDIDLVMRRISITAIVSLFPSIILTGILSLIYSADSRFERMITVFLILEITITLTLYTIEYWMTRLEPTIFPRKHGLQIALKNISHNLRSISSFRELKDIVLVDIVNTLDVLGGAIAICYNDTVEIIREGDIEEEEVLQLIESGLMEHPEFSIFEINGHAEYTSFLIMTQKKTRTLLGTEERNWLSLIITYLAVSLENVYLIRKLTMRLQQLAAQIPAEEASNELAWFRKLMFELQERERVRIATDLHDTTMQDLFFLKERLRMLLDHYSFTKQDQERVHGIMDYIDIINTNLRQNCFELHPYLLKEIGLVDTIERLIDMERLVRSFDISFKPSSVAVLEAQSIETKRHLFRIIQELLNNARKHSRAERLRISLQVVGTSLQLYYEDDGVGFEPNFISSREIGGKGIGLEQLKGRTHSLNGHIEIETGIGRGLRITITIPIDKEEESDEF